MTTQADETPKKNKSKTYVIRPKISVFEKGQLLKCLRPITGQNAFKIGDDVDNMMTTFDNDEAVFSSGDNETEVLVAEDTICMFVEDEQFIGSDGNTPTSAWIRWKLIADGKVILYTACRTQKRVWDFETFRGKRKRILDSISNTFEVVNL